MIILVCKQYYNNRIKKISYQKRNNIEILEVRKNNTKKLKNNLKLERKKNESNLQNIEENNQNILNIDQNLVVKEHIVTSHFNNHLNWSK